MTGKTGDSIAPPVIPEVLADWIKQRGFDVCPWKSAPAGTRKVVGKDAWRFGTVVLFRVPLDVCPSGVRYYAAIHQRAEHRKAVGYWLEVRELPIAEGDSVSESGFGV
jgi:hypothetical protein